MVSLHRNNYDHSLTHFKGMWLAAEGKRLEYAEDIYSITSSEDSKKLSLLCPTAQIRSRGDTLNRPTISLVWTNQPSPLLFADSIVGHRSSSGWYHLSRSHPLAWSPQQGTSL
jgi:hypothetical protein